MTNLSSSQEKAETLIILYSIFASKEAENEELDIIVRSSDTDVFLLLIAFCDKFKHPLYFDTRSANKRRMIHINILCQIHKDIQDSILGLHAFTCCDVNNAFAQKGKKKTIHSSSDLSLCQPSQNWTRMRQYLKVYLSCWKCLCAISMENQIIIID